MIKKHFFKLPLRLLDMLRVEQSINFFMIVFHREKKRRRGAQYALSLKVKLKVKIKIQLTKKKKKKRFSDALNHLLCYVKLNEMLSLASEYN